MNEGYEIYLQGRQAMNDGKLEDAVNLFQKSTLLSPHFKTFELLGECLLKLKRYNEAVGPLAAAVALNKGVRAPSLLAEVFLAMGENSDAREFAELALSRDPNNKKAGEILSKVEAT
jgi:tetratricopeptide (TPR) repeat protein